MSEPEYKWVPVEPTYKMICAVLDTPNENKEYSGFLPKMDYATRVCKAMLAAAPSTPKDPRDEALKVAREALDAMISDGWLSYGPEGMSEAQNKCYDAHLKIKEIMGEK